MSKDQTQWVRKPSSLKWQWAPAHTPGRGFLENPGWALDYIVITETYIYPKVTLNNFSDPLANPQSQSGQKEDLEAKTEAERGTRWLPTKLRNICFLMRHLAGRVKKSLHQILWEIIIHNGSYSLQFLKTTIVNNKCLHLFLAIFWKA